MLQFRSLFILATLFLSSCSNKESLTEDEILLSIFEKVEKETSSRLNYEITTDEDDVVTINIQIETPAEMMTDQTTVLQKCFDAISAEGLHFDMYFLLSQDGGVALGVTRVDLEYISMRTENVMDFMANLKQRKKEGMMGFILPGAFSGGDIDTLISRCSGRLMEFDYNYEGYELTQRDGITYCNFIFKSNGGIYRLNYDLTNKETAISNIEYPS